MDAIINGEKEVVTSVKAPTVESSVTSAPNGKRSTKSTKSLTPELMLEILEQAFVKFQESGGQIQKKCGELDNKKVVVLVLENVIELDGHLVLAQ